jgi:DNA-binding transcriptional MerR regulator
MSTKKGMKGAELCRSLDIQPYVLRYWETEFKALQAPAGGGTQRTYNDADIALVRRIKKLLYEEGYTIAGARKKLESEPVDSGNAPAPSPLFDPPTPSEVEASPAPATVAEPPATSDALDTASSERIKQLRHGSEGALADARSVLRILDKHPR